MATNVVLKSGQLADLQNVSIKDGTLYVAKKENSTAELHVDFGNFRYRISDAPAGTELGAVKSGGDVTITDGIIELIYDSLMAFELSIELGLIDPPVSEDGAIYIDENGTIYSL